MPNHMIQPCFGEKPEAGGCWVNAIIGPVFSGSFLHGGIESGLKRDEYCFVFPSQLPHKSGSVSHVLDHCRGHVATGQEKRFA